MACDSQVPLPRARSQWWICTTCGSYICTSCRALFLETGQGICPGTIVRGVKAHPPHFTRFLGPRNEQKETDSTAPSRVILLGDVQPSTSQSPGGRVIILENANADNDVQNKDNGQKQ